MGAKYLAAFLAAHLILVTVSGFRGFLVSLNDAELSKLKMKPYPDALEQYGSLFAAGQGFGFFAPGVASEARVVVLACKRGHTNWHPIDIGLRGESQHFLNAFVGIGIRGPGRKPISQSIAAYALSRHAEEDSVIIQYQAELIPPLREERVPRAWITLEAFYYYR